MFQDGALERLLGFESQGFVDAWAPIFFFALAFALAMDYTVFLLATIKVHERTGDARQAVVEGLAGTGRVINAAAAVMVVVFMTFALAGPLPPRRWASSSPSRCCSTPRWSGCCSSRSSSACSAAWWMPWLDRLLPEVALSHGMPEAEPGHAIPAPEPEGLQGMSFEALQARQSGRGARRRGSPWPRGRPRSTTTSWPASLLAAVSAGSTSARAPARSRCARRAREHA